MKFLYEYRTKDNVRHEGVICAASKDAAFSALKAQGIRPGSVKEAPGFFNKLFGKGKRWIAIGVLSAVCVALGVAFLGRARTPDAPQPSSVDEVLDSTMRRQVIGDVAVIEEGIRTGWAGVFDLEGERFLASFAIPGVPAGQRSTTEAEIQKALRTPHSALRTPHLLEERQIRSMVEGMKGELREFLSAGGTIAAYGRRLVERQEAEIGYYNRAKADLDRLVADKADEKPVEALWKARNEKLRRLGIKLLTLPESE